MGERWSPLFGRRLAELARPWDGAVPAALAKLADEIEARASGGPAANRRTGSNDSQASVSSAADGLAAAELEAALETDDAGADLRGFDIVQLAAVLRGWLTALPTPLLLGGQAAADFLRAGTCGAELDVAALRHCVQSLAPLERAVLGRLLGLCARLSAGLDVFAVAAGEPLGAFLRQQYKTAKYTARQFHFGRRFNRTRVGGGSAT